MKVDYSARSGGIIGIFFSIFFNMKACRMFSLELPHQCDSNEHTQHAIINIKKKITLNYPKYNNVCSYGNFSLGTRERVRNSRGKLAIGIRAIEVLLYVLLAILLIMIISASITFDRSLIAKIHGVEP